MFCYLLGRRLQQLLVFPVQMLRQMFFPDSGVGTEMATERLLPRVYADMPIEVAFLPEHFLAKKTGERFRAVFEGRLLDQRRLRGVTCRTINA